MRREFIQEKVNRLRNPALESSDGRLERRGSTREGGPRSTRLPAAQKRSKTLTGQETKSRIWKLFFARVLTLRKEARIEKEAHQRETRILVQ